MTCLKQLWWGQEWETVGFKRDIIYFSPLPPDLVFKVSISFFLFLFFSFMEATVSSNRQAQASVYKSPKITLPRYFDLFLPSSLIPSECTANSLLRSLIVLSLQQWSWKCIFCILRLILLPDRKMRGVPSSHCQQVKSGFWNNVDFLFLSLLPLMTFCVEPFH